jgi:predicted CxxxxCH...CXXCH cytochrome family protein
MGGAPNPCSACHYDTVTDQGTRSRDAASVSVYDPVPIANAALHADGDPDVAFSTDTVRVIRRDHDLTTADYDPTTKTCTNVACHFDETTVQWGEPYRYDNFVECNQCHQY